MWLIGFGVGGMKSYTEQGYPAAQTDAVANIVQWKCCLSTACRGTMFQINGLTFMVLWGGSVNLMQGVPVEVILYVLFQCNKIIIHVLRNVTLHKIPGAGFWCTLNLTLACLLNMNYGL